jgi:hypothetical protein
LAIQTTKIGIINRGLQLVGAPAINSVQENSRGARAMNRAYDSVKLNELRKHFWNFSIKRISIPASATPPAFGKGNYFPLPGDFLMLAPMDQDLLTTTDWQIEGNQIASNDLGPINVRYVSSDLVESLFDVSFAEALSAALAMNTAEELTQSNSKIQNAAKAYDDAIKQARRRNAFENRPVQSPTDTWITARF